MTVLTKGGTPTAEKIVPQRGGESTGSVSCASTPDQDEKLRADYLSTINACRYVLSGYESESMDAKKQKRWLMIIGAVAGSVMVPTLAAGNSAKTAIAGWGGLSGVTNVASHTMESEGLDAVYFLGTRDNVRKSLDEGIKKFVNSSSDYCQRRSAVEEMAAACTSYSIYQTPEKK